MTQRAETVPSALAGQRIDRMVALVADVSRAEAVTLLAAGRVRIDGAVAAKVSERVAEGAVVEIDLPDASPPDPGVAPEPDVAVAVVLTDDAFVVVDKAPGLVVHPGAGHGHGTLVAGLLARYPEIAEVGDPERPGIVHRLDRDTSGLLVVARTPAAYDHLVAQLAARTVSRHYQALIVGRPDAAQGLIDAPIGRSPRQPTLMAVRSDGKEARTRYEVHERFDRPSPTALVTCRLETGRTHQIRAHMKAIGHPVVGDIRYGGGRSEVSCPRTFLHAAHLAFAHPVTGDPVTADAPLPGDLAAVLAAVRSA
ncbi:RluA family pseudouridine synthase [Iamia sp.]|uniref:RluA family pseudouridine synthase n=1 Tax=Iamia sp. TaxID=2722710 RepID=UPI002CEA444B|nr:RluA family pseudouridine synthase [Iamia sp.]HXH56436.1 RluA family pseudouridine synthase [Iamia sp.]